MSIHAELDELVATSGNANTGWCYLPSRPNHTTRMVQPRVCVGDNILVSLHTRAHDHSTTTTIRQHQLTRVCALVAHHPAWMSHHPSGSWKDTHGTLGPVRGEAVGGSQDAHTAQEVHGTRMTLNMVAEHTQRPTPNVTTGDQPKDWRATTREPSRPGLFRMVWTMLVVCTSARMRGHNYRYLAESAIGSAKSKHTLHAR